MRDTIVKLCHISWLTSDVPSIIGVARIFAVGECTLFLPQKLTTFFSHCPPYTGYSPKLTTRTFRIQWKNFFKIWLLTLPGVHLQPWPSKLSHPKFQSSPSGCTCTQSTRLVCLCLLCTYTWHQGWKIALKNEIIFRYFRDISSIRTYMVLTVSTAVLLLSLLGS